MGKGSIGNGHACGHNLIAEAGVAAGLGIKAAMESCQGGIKGRVTVLGTPAEESFGGKIKLINSGAFDDVDVAMMVHPAPVNMVFLPTLALCTYQITYTGITAHAAACPSEGVNALDAAVIAYNSISALRQQMKPDWSVSGVIKEGGVRSNMIPGKAVMEYMIRAPTVAELFDKTDGLNKKIQACFHAGANATGCEIVVTQMGEPLHEVRSNKVLGERFQGNMPDIVWAKDVHSTGSTDMGKVSFKVPSIHPWFCIGKGQVNHTLDFTDASNEDDAHDAALQFAKGLALTGWDVLTDPHLLDDIWKEHEPRKNAVGGLYFCLR